ncbi:hypothetical protein [Streptomyces sp. NPDC058335]|uniref:hypothetical protein n=1 Tax=Streptomyces sp. NPDC058335 TaxID=3346451 RepID=UPI0036460791
MSSSGHQRSRPRRARADAARIGPWVGHRLRRGATRPSSAAPIADHAPPPG